MLALLQSQAEGASDIASGSTAVETACRGLWMRAFAVADVQPQTPATMALTGVVLSLMAESLFDRGQSIWAIEVEGGRVALRQASDWDIRNDHIRLSIASPDTILTRYLPHDQVIDLKISAPIGQPWNGSSPVSGQSGTSARLLAAIEQRLGQEVAGTVGFVLPMPTVDDSTKQLQADIPKSEGPNGHGSIDGGELGSGTAASGTALRLETV